jgi:adenylate cyclase
MYRRSVLIGLVAAVIFSLLFLIGVFDRLEDQIYDFLLKFRANRERISDLVFLDVDDPAIAYKGEFPWPRSIIADALLRLKEYDVRSAIFDIEYIDKGPQGVDTIYLNQGLSADFNRTFTGIHSDSAELFQSFFSGRISRSDLEEYSKYFNEQILSEHDNLFTRSQRIARDNDQYLFQCSALFGRSWATLNLREPGQPLLEEQLKRRPIAEELFSYGVYDSGNAFKGKYIDILPCLPGFAMAAQGAGFTNVEIDKDGIRRRIDLAQNVHDHWYLQLAFSPLIHYLGNPEIHLSNRRAILKGAKMPDGVIKDISIPLDGHGRMLLDWPKEDYTKSYTHISFHDFSLLEDLEAELERYSRALGEVDFHFFLQFDPSLVRLPLILGSLDQSFEDIKVSRDAAIEQCSEEYFANYLKYRGNSRESIQDILDIDPGAKLRAMLTDLVDSEPERADSYIEETEYVESLSEALKINLFRHKEISEQIKERVNDKFCVLGRVDTGTTDYGANPFYGKYINVGTHGVVIDMILSETFIFPVGIQWNVLFNVIIVTLFFLLSSKLPPVTRTVSGFIMVLLVAFSSAILFRITGMFFSPLLTLFSMISAVIVREIISYAGSEREKQFIRKAFSTYVSDDVVKEIIADPSRLQLGGTKRHMSAIFTDVKGFSGISEALDPENLVSLLNRYLTFMSDAILDEKGTIDKYEGDAIIAFFGAPMPLPDHALRACESALAIKRIESELNKKIIEENLSPEPLLTRIGINTGSMVAGNMGTGNKMNYTIMGNAVNLAARLEGVNKQYGTWIIASDATVQETQDRILTRKLDRVRVVGITEPVRLHELLEISGLATPEQKKLVEVFHQALEYYENRKWNEAIEGFKESFSIENGGPSEVYLRRCKTYTNYPPPDDWDGVHNLTEK